MRSLSEYIIIKFKIYNDVDIIIKKENELNLMKQ